LKVPPGSLARGSKYENVCGSDQMIFDRGFNSRRISAAITVTATEKIAGKESAQSMIISEKYQLAKAYVYV
jgi:hypothetical protein